ncbi:uncharacterized protein [Halyomorpha halys]|nr:uncharacterized protein LOC106681799 isoform X2 [Halyomorpha halys]
MGPNMHSNMPSADSETIKVRPVPLYKLKARSTPHPAEEALIYAVYKRRPLWDPAVHFYRNNTVIKILWEEVANETGLTDHQAKGRWKSLRDYYRLELKKLNKIGGEEPKKSNWNHFNSMSFLYDLMSPKKSGELEGDIQMAEESQSSTEGMDQPTDTEDIYVKDEEARPPCWRPLTVDSTSGPIREPVQEPISSSKSPNRNGEVVRKVLIELERRRLDLLEKKNQMEDDDDLQYLKSLLPLIKMLPLRKKIGVRIKFQEIISKEIEELDRGSGMN